MSECIFGKIIKGDLLAKKIYEDERTIAILDKCPITLGHSLVIPKNHIVSYTGLTPDDAGPFSRAIWLLTRKLKLALNAEYISILIRGTRVPHLHSHLIPKFKNEDNIFDRSLDLIHYFQFVGQPFRVASNPAVCGISFGFLCTFVYRLYPTNSETSFISFLFPFS